jgi:RNA polymerase sigma-70 factor (ECF subfamily)
MPRTAEQLAALFMRHRDLLRRIIQYRLDDRLAQRLDVADVLQEVYLQAQLRLAHADKMEGSPLFWLRQVTEQTLIDLYRRHLEAECRDAGREVSLNQPAASSASGVGLAGMLAADQSSPSQAALRAERHTLLEQALDQMDPTDREVLVFRHFVELSNNEVAEILGLQPTAASNRYIRALQRLKQIMASLPPFATES